MTSDPAALYSAYAARDARFDGVFFVGVTSTRIYCRPVCTARTPKRGNCRFFDSAAAAEQASFRPCLRCRPELAPGNARVDGGRREAGRIAQRIAAGMFEEGAGVEDIAAEFFMSARHMRRIVHRELGVSPMQLVLTQRLLLAKQLLTETALTVTDVAYSSGFSSVRRFNDAFLRRYGMPPTRLRRQQAAPPGLPGELPPTPRPLTLQLAYRPPFDWSGMLGFVARRTLVGIEHVDGGAFSRTVRIGGHSGRIRVQDAPAGRVLLVEITQSLTPVLPALLARVRRLFDLDARPDVIAARLGRDPRFRRALARAPGLRVPGAFDGFELVVRAILGQQVTVRTAAAIAGRFATAYGEPVETGDPALTRLTPSPERMATETEAGVASIGIVRSRARSIIAVAEEMAAGRLRIEPGVDVAATVRQLTAIRGIGPWTAQYIAMRGLRWPDAFPGEDIAVRNALGGVSAAEAEALSQAWRPWRSYAVLHLWRGPD